RNSTARLPAPIASSNRPSFISAIPSACQPSKKSGSSSTHRRYFSTALAKSPTATSPLASSKISSGVAIYFVLAPRTQRSQRNTDIKFQPDDYSVSFARFVRTLPFLIFQACRLLPVAQPFHNNNTLLVLKNSLFEGCFFLA